MSTFYRYRLHDAEYGPVGFRELVRLVRDGTISTDDPVIADWEDEWHPAAEVVGLFHMAGRKDVLEKWEAERRARQGISEEDVPEEATEAASDEPSWQRRFREVQQEQHAREAERRREQEFELAGRRTAAGIADSIAAAEDRLDQRDAARQPGRLQLMRESLFSASALHALFRWGMAFIAANMAAFAVLNWTETEALRFPERTARTPPPPVFPIWGECSQAEYLFLLMDTMLAAGLIGYGIARVLELFADD
ncbi:hypothetical protein Mal4_39090 [Maioricimonas rarisocia]|uniref:GYF domain-containing protein n=1 Tax=Maioricimonas rarisocia TaxID=2528026 RepID=A0A517ZAP8_9PLAN|nr:GYF domain-containing protein [Maioricimonas rarisocia]QDU39564.1 hypothetical protein Mal4_39090 [Maioricimonas rarisocia]